MRVGCTKPSVIWHSARDEREREREGERRTEVRESRTRQMARHLQNNASLDPPCKTNVKTVSSVLAILARVNLFSLSLSLCPSLSLFLSLWMKLWLEIRSPEDVPDLLSVFDQVSRKFFWYKVVCKNVKHPMLMSNVKYAGYGKITAFIYLKWLYLLF